MIQVREILPGYADEDPLRAAIREEGDGQIELQQANALANQLDDVSFGLRYLDDKPARLWFALLDIAKANDDEAGQVACETMLEMCATPDAIASAFDDAGPIRKFRAIVREEMAKLKP